MQPVLLCVFYNLFLFSVLFLFWTNPRFTSSHALQCFVYGVDSASFCAENFNEAICCVDSARGDSSGIGSPVTCSHSALPIQVWLAKLNRAAITLSLLLLCTGPVFTMLVFSFPFLFRDLVKSLTANVTLSSAGTSVEEAIRICQASRIACFKVGDWTHLLMQSSAIDCIFGISQATARTSGRLYSPECCVCTSKGMFSYRETDFP